MSIATRGLNAWNAPSVGDGLHVRHDFSNSLELHHSSALEGLVLVSLDAQDVRILGCFTPAAHTDGELPRSTHIQYKEGHQDRHAVLQIRGVMDEAALELGDRVYEAFEQQGVRAQRLIRLKNGGISFSVADGGSMAHGYVTNYREGRWFQGDADKMEAFGRMLGKMRRACEAIEKGDPDLVAQVKDYTDSTTLKAWQLGQGEAGKDILDKFGLKDKASLFEGVSGIIQAWPEISGILSGDEDVDSQPRHINMFNVIPKHILVLKDGELGVTSMAAAARGYVWNMTEKVSYDMALGAYRSVLDADRFMREDAPEMNARDIKANLCRYLEGYNAETGGDIKMSELMTSIHRVNALDTIVVSGLLSVMADYDPGVKAHLADVVQQHLIKKQKHFELIQKADRAVCQPEPEAVQRPGRDLKPL